MIFFSSIHAYVIIHSAIRYLFRENEIKGGLFRNNSKRLERKLTLLSRDEISSMNQFFVLFVACRLIHIVFVW